MNSAASPSATADVCTSKPVHKPKVTDRPALGPFTEDWVNTKILSGPGASANRTEAITKLVNDSMGITAIQFRIFTDFSH